jgi:HEPN domain-containing protein
MTNIELIEYWIKAAELDLPVMEKLFHSGDYVWSLYIGHLVLEKITKIHFVSIIGSTPPKTHNLIKLSELSGLTKDIEKLKLFDEINEFNIEARYPDIKFDLYKKCNQEFAKFYKSKIEELFQWIKSEIKH